MNAQKRVYYLSPNILENFRRFHGEDFMPSSGGNKIASLASALGTTGVSCWTVSCPVVSTGKKRLYRSALLRGDGYNSVYLPGIRDRWLNRPFALFTYARFCVKRVRRRDRVVLYDYFPEYLFAALILRIRHNPAILDVEDGRRQSPVGALGVFSQLAFPLLRRLCCKRFVVASQSIASQLGDGAVCHVCHGVSHSASPVRREFQALNVLYSGAKAVEWGTQLFAQAVSRLALEPASIRARMRFVVTGYGDFSSITKVQQEVADLMDLQIMRESSTSQYADFMDSSNVGLELRIPGTEGAETTFPSKLMEFAGNGLLIVTTGTGDVPNVLNTDAALFLAEASGEALAAALVSVLANPEKWAIVVARGSQQARDLHSQVVVGKSLRDFLFSSV